MAFALVPARPLFKNMKKVRNVNTGKFFIHQKNPYPGKGV
jgi:hypothetical protein